MGKMFQAATNYLPAQVSGMMNQDRAFATVRLNISGQRNICALSTYVLTSVSHCHTSLQADTALYAYDHHCACYLAPCRAHSVCLLSVYACSCCVWTCDAFLLRIQKLPRLLVTTSDGHLYIYNLDPQDGGECVLIQKHR